MSKATEHDRHFDNICDALRSALRFVHRNVHDRTAGFKDTQSILIRTTASTDNISSASVLPSSRVEQESVNEH